MSQSTNKSNSNQPNNSNKEALKLIIAGGIWVAISLTELYALIQLHGLYYSGKLILEEWEYQWIGLGLANLFAFTLFFVPIIYLSKADI